MSAATEPPRQAHRTLSSMGSASTSLVQLFWRGKPAPGGRLPPGASAQVAEDQERLPVVPVLHVAQEALHLLSMASSLLPQRVGLEEFVGLLQGHGVLSGRLDYSADEGILQKCAFIAQEGFGLNLAYRYHLHAYGTFSSLMAADFARLARRTARAVAHPMPTRFREKKFLSLVSKKGLDWLCVASIVVHERGSYGPGELRRHVERMSASHNRGLVKGAIREIDDALGPARRARRG